MKLVKHGRSDAEWQDYYVDGFDAVYWEDGEMVFSHVHYTEKNRTWASVKSPDGVRAVVRKWRLEG